jgi:hypothetical protein
MRVDDTQVLSEIRLVLKDVVPQLIMKKLPNFVGSINIILKVNPSGPVIVTVPVVTAPRGLLSR